MDRCHSFLSCNAVLLAAAITLLAPMHATGAQSEGTREVQIAGGFFHNQGDASTGTASGHVSIGYYPSSQWQVGARQLFSYSLNDDIEDVWTGSSTVFVHRYFLVGRDRGRLQPFIGAFAGVAYSDVDITGTAGPTLGVKYFIKDTTFVNLQYRYEWYVDSLDAGDETSDFTDGNHTLAVGIGLQW